MNLKTNFKNDKFSGLRKYKMTTDASTGLTTLEDKTEYQEIGDILRLMILTKPIRLYYKITQKSKISKV